MKARKLTKAQKVNSLTKLEMLEVRGASHPIGKIIVKK